MKTTLLSLILLFFVSAGFTQSKFTTITGPNKNLCIKPVTAHPDLNYSVFAGVPGMKIYDFTTIGTTWNDAQTINYGNIMQRMWAYPDGTIGSTWLGEGENVTPERGAGYNYFDAMEWGDPVMHVGTEDRQGSPCYAPWGPEGEIIATYRYIANEGPIYLFKREVKGEGEWEQVILDPPSGCSIVWHSIMTSGENHEYIHILADTYDDPYNGMTNALLYYRSSDGGETWEISEETIDGLGPDDLPTINHLSYSWANPVGNTIAFTYGFDEWGGSIFKSFDNGDTWEEITVFTTPFDPFDPPETSADFGAGIGSSAIVLDSQGKAHVAFPRMVRVFVDGSANLYPYTDGLIYWNEDMEPLDTAHISATTMEYLEESGNLIGWILGDESYEVPADQPTYANALCGFPVMSIDTDDNMFVAYSAVAPGYTNGLVNYRHIVLNASFDGGTLWAGPEDLNTDLIFIFSECAYPMMAPFIEEYVQLTYQEDSEPGTYGWPNQQAEQNENNIHHMMIEKGSFVDIPENSIRQGMEVSECHPNPAQDNMMLQINLEEGKDVSIRIVNVMGQLVKEFPEKALNQGSNPVNINVSEFNPGIYYCSIKAGQQQITRKFVVKK